MCGIAGLISTDDTLFQTDIEIALTRMGKALAHRGPDGSGQWISPAGRIGLCHRRLAIVDLSASASQPMSIEGDSVVCVFNGEIYNHRELRSELAALGVHAWKTDHSDTEVILWAYKTWGIQCLHRFRGMFAFALWDENEQSLVLARDRIGEKPLYYALYDGRFAFASEMKGLLSDPRIDRSVDSKALYYGLSFLATPAPMTMFRSIRKVPAGSYLRIDRRGRITATAYWDVLDHMDPKEDLSDGELSERVDRTLRESVRLRKESDVPVGVFLSGGIDSSTNTALFAENEEQPVQTFSIGYKGNLGHYRNELPYARLVADRYKTVHHELLVDQQTFLDFIPEMARFQEEPISDPVCAATYFLAKSARQANVKVCQVGEGADELFVGYPSWLLRWRAQRLLNSVPIPREIIHLVGAAFGKVGRDSRSYDAIQRASNGLPIFIGGIDAFTESQKQHLLSSRVLDDLEGISSFDAIRPHWERFLGMSPVKSIFRWMTYIDLKLRLPEHLLMRADKMTMAVALEARAPFLDHKLVELLMSASDSSKIREGQLKYLLRRLGRKLLPKPILDRPKQGFAVPLMDWFSSGMRGKILAEIADFADHSGLFNVKSVKRMIPRFGAKRLWYIYNLALWWKTFVA